MDGFLHGWMGMELIYNDFIKQSCELDIWNRDLIIDSQSLVLLLLLLKQMVMGSFFYMDG